MPAYLSPRHEPVRNTDGQSTLVSIRNNYSLPITAAVIQIQCLYDDGSVLVDWTPYVDSLITEPKPIFPGSVTTLDFGGQTIANAPLDQVIGRLILFEDGTWVGDNTGLAEALRTAREFSDEQEGAHAEPDERSALVTAVGSFAENLRVKYFSPGKPVFSQGTKSYYETRAFKLTNGKPSI